jgi:hypothetical protein
MKVHSTLEEEWSSYFSEVLEKHGVDKESAPGLRQIFFAGAGSALALQETVSVGKLRVEVMQFHDALLVRLRRN